MAGVGPSGDGVSGGAAGAGVRLAWAAGPAAIFSSLHSGTFLGQGHWGPWEGGSQGAACRGLRGPPDSDLGPLRATVRAREQAGRETCQWLSREAQELLRGEDVGGCWARGSSARG